MAPVGDRTPAVWSLCAPFCHTSTWSASWTPCCRTDRVTASAWARRASGKRVSAGVIAPRLLPHPLLHAGAGDLRCGPGGHQDDGGAEEAVLLGAHQLLPL